MTWKSMAALAAALAAATVAAAAAHAQPAPLSPTDIVGRHIAAGNAGDLDAMAGDYADDAVVLQPGQAVQGKAAIRAMFAGIFGPGAPKMTITPPKVWQEGEVGFVTWTANGGAIRGQDSFLVKNGKIEAQAVFIGAPPAPPAGP